MKRYLDDLVPRPIKRTRPNRRPRVQSYLRISFLVVLVLDSIAHAAPKLEEVFKSTQDNFGEQSDNGRFFAWLIAVIGMIILLALLHRQWQKRMASPRVVNNQGKLVRQLQKQINIKSAELKQLKLLTEDSEVQNPLTLLLCPSLLVKAARANPERVDRKLISSMIKRMG